MNDTSQPDSSKATRFVFIADPLVFGAICGLISAVAYTAANVCLRAVANCDPMWVSCVKSFPTFALVGPWLIVLASRRVRVLPPWKTLGAILLAGVFGQLGGNVLFQWSLGVIGMAMAVPITLGTIIVTGAMMGRMFLGEGLTVRATGAMFVLIVAVCVLSLGAGDAHRSVIDTGVLSYRSVGLLKIVAGVAAAAVSGFAYSVLAVVIRYGVTGKSPVSTTMVTISIMGTIGLGWLSYLRVGGAVLLDTDPTDFGVMMLAGIFNAAAFLTLTKALQLTTVTYVNALSASQAAMAAIAGVVIFHEATTGTLVTGVVLTMIGLLMMNHRDRAPKG